MVVEPQCYGLDSQGTFDRVAGLSDIQEGERHALGVVDVRC